MNQLYLLACLVLAVTAMPHPDSAGIPPLPGPGLSYGGIPYGSMSGNVAEYFKRQAPSSGRRANYVGYSHHSPAAHSVDYSPIEHWL